MAVCEKCWADSFGKSLWNGKTRYENYLEILESRKDHPCTPGEQAGGYWDEEKQCDIRYPKKQ